MGCGASSTQSGRANSALLPHTANASGRSNKIGPHQVVPAHQDENASDSNSPGGSGVRISHGDDFSQTLSEKSGTSHHWRQTLSEKSGSTERSRRVSGTSTTLCGTEAGTNYWEQQSHYSSADNTLAQVPTPKDSRSATPSDNSPRGSADFNGVLPAPSRSEAPNLSLSFGMLPCGSMPVGLPKKKEVSGSEPMSGSESSQDSLPKVGTEHDDLPLCPLVGCSLAFLEFFASEWSNNASLRSPQSSLDFTMGTVCQKIIKPLTRDSAKRRISREDIQNSISYQSFKDANDDDRFKAPGSAESSDAHDESKMKPVTALGSVENSDESKTPHLEALRAAVERSMDDGTAGDSTDTLSFAELAMMAGLLDTRGKPAFAKATYFVSHAWRYIFAPFVEAIRYWVSSNNIVEDHTYFWVDAFVVNQHATQNYPQEWWSTRFMQAVGEIGNTILVLEPWDSPVPFKRAWVVWEMYCTSVTGARLHLAMRPETMANFNLALETSFETVQSALSNIDVTLSEAFHQRDQAMIHGEIQRTIGFVKLNEIIQTRLMQWLMERAKIRMLAMKLQEEQSDYKGPYTKRFKLADHLARMHRESGNLDVAEKGFTQLLAEVKEKLGPNDMFTLGCMNQLAVTLQKIGKEQQAMEMHRECLNCRVQLLGNHHADVLQSTSNLAVLVASQKPLSQENFEEALALYKQAIAGREASCGPDHPSTLYTVTNLAKLLSEAPAPSLDYFLEAEDLHHRAVEKLVAILHGTHPLTLTALHNQACHWLALEQFQADLTDKTDRAMLTKCTEQLNRVHTTRTQKLGKQHPDTLRTEMAVIECNDLRKRRTSLITSYSSWAQLSLEEFLAANTYDHFLAIRKSMRSYGIKKLMNELCGLGIVNAETGKLTVGMQPFNIFARLASGVQTQAPMIEQQEHLGKYKDQFMVACNRPENDEMWNSSEPAWIGKASMSKRHVFLLIKTLEWEWFNVLSFGFVSGLEEALRILRDAREAAHMWVKAQPDWSDRVGLFVHVYAHSSVPSLHIHILDMETLGPTWDALRYKNLSIEDVIAVVETEIQQYAGLDVIEEQDGGDVNDLAVDPVVQCG